MISAKLFLPQKLLQSRLIRNGKLNEEAITVIRERSDPAAQTGLVSK